mgnify:CR=1 FL=1
MRKFISVLLLCHFMSALSQTTFDAIKADVRSWCNEHKTAFVLNSKVPKTLEFLTQHYSIEGVISKGILCEGTIAKFYETSSLAPNLLLEGKVTYNASRLVIDGIKYESTPTGTNKIYGSFYVYNMNDYSMNYKVKKAGALRIKCQNASYLEGFYLQCPVIVSLIDESSTVYVDGKTGGRGYAFLSAIIPGITLNEDDSFDVYQILLRAKDDVTMCWDNGIVFEGSVKSTVREDSTIVFQTLYGQRIGMTSGPKKISVSHESGNIVYTMEDNDDNQLLSKETMYVRDDGTLSEMDYWNAGKIYENCYLAQWTYRNRNYFEGSIKSVVTSERISSTATKGVFKYPNGDRFEGDVSSKSVGSFFVDGTTYFVDGSKVKGNWLDNYTLSDSQWEEVYKCPNPSEAIALAKKLVIEYEKQAKEERYQSLVDRVKALGETPYQKALAAWRDKCLRRLEKECWVSGQTILGSIMIEGLAGSVINQTTIGASMAPAFMEAALNRPMVCKSIVSEMDVELKQIVKLAQPVEIELEKLQSEKLKSK